MYNMLKEIVLTAVLLVVIDFVYLTMMTPLLNKLSIDVQGSKVQLNLYGAVLCYIFLIFGLYYFIIKDKRSIMDAFLLGLVIYTVYEFTSIAFLKNWYWSVAIIDSLWGATLFAITTALVYKISKLKYI